MGLFKSKGRTVMNCKFIEQGNFLIIKLSGSVEINDRLLTKEPLTSYLRKSLLKVIVDLGDLKETEEVYVLGVLNTIKKECRLVGGEVKLCSLRPMLLRYFEENRLDKIFDIRESVDQAKQSFGGETNAV
jgi:anti-anti-sigma factor